MDNCTIFRGKIGRVGPINFFIDSGELIRIEFGYPSCPPTGWPRVPFNREIKRWARTCLDGTPTKFPYKLHLKGTEFQWAVWKTLQKIPYGEVRTYRWVAEKIGRSRAVRAVGNACGANPIPLIIPCHRVVASNGIGGFSAGLHIKKKLLAIEKSIKP